MTSVSSCWLISILLAPGFVNTCLVGSRFAKLSFRCIFSRAVCCSTALSLARLKCYDVSASLSNRSLKELRCLWPIRNWEREQDGKWIVDPSKFDCDILMMTAAYYGFDSTSILLLNLDYKRNDAWRGSFLFCDKQCDMFSVVRVLLMCLKEYWSGAWSRDTWLILPVVICFVRGLSHACLSMNTFCTVKLQIAHYISYSLFDDCPVTRITVVILELIRAQNLDSCEKRCTY